ncbi:MAG: cytochrome c peroxidase [Acetobacter sp.]
MLIALGMVAGLSSIVAAGPAHAQECLPADDGRNPCPVALVRPASPPLSAMALVGRDIFFDRALSGSGRLSCASCHVPYHDYAPAGSTAFMAGGCMLFRQGCRIVPSLKYLDRQPAFMIVPFYAES